MISYFDRKHQSSTVSCRKVLVHRSASVEKIHTCYQRSIVGYAPLSGRKDSVGNFNKSINKRTLQKRVKELLIHISTISRIGKNFTNNPRMVIWQERKIIDADDVEMWISQPLKLLPYMAVAFLRPSPHGRDPSCPGSWLSMDRSLISQVVASCQGKVTLTVRDWAPSLIRDSRRRRDGTWSWGRGNHPTKTQPAN